MKKNNESIKFAIASQKLRNPSIPCILKAILIYDIDKTRKDDPNKLGPGTYDLNTDSVTKTSGIPKICNPVKVKNLKHKKEFIDDLVRFKQIF